MQSGIKNIFVVIFCFILNLSAYATSIEEKIPLYLQPPTNLIFSNNPIYVNFCDERIKDKCTSPSRDLQLAGQKINDKISIEPKIKGDWRVYENYAIGLVPQESFRANQIYKVTIDKSLWPSFITLTKNNISFETMPLLPLIKEMVYFQDYGEVSKKLVQTKIQFNYPIAQNSLKERLNFIRENTKEKLPFTIKFNDSNTEATIITNIKSLDKKEDRLLVRIGEGVQPLHGGEAFLYKNLENKKYQEPIFTTPMPYETLPVFKKGDMGNIYKILKYGYKEQVLIPSIYSLKIEAKAGVIKNDDDTVQRIIVVTTNEPTLSSEIKNHLELFLLPKDKPGSSEQNYTWKSPQEITSDIMFAVKKIDFKPLLDTQEYSTTHSFQINIQSNSYVLLKLKQGVKAKDNLILQKDYSQILFIPPLSSELKLIPQGAVLSLPGEKKLKIYSAGLDKIHVEIAKINQKDINHLVSQTRSYNIFQSPNFINEFSFNEYNISKVFEEDIEATKESYIDFTKYLNRDSSVSGYDKGLFLTKISSKDKEDKRLVLITDLGFFVKKDQEGLHHIFVSSITGSGPLKDVKVDIISLNGEILLTRQTDSDGHVILPNITNVEKDKQPIAYIVTLGNDFSFMPYEQMNIFSQSNNEKIKTYLFSDRGIYKPGEKGNIGILVKSSNWEDKFLDLPVELSVTNPRGVVIDKKKINLTAEGMAEYSFQTSENSPVGTYNIDLYLIKDELTNNIISSTSVRVQDFLPDKMKITASFNKDKNKLWVSPENLEATVNLVNLYGTSATKRKINAYINIAPVDFQIPAFKDYIFYSDKNISYLTQQLLENITDEQGIAKFKLDTRPLWKLAYREEFEEDTERRNAAYSNDRVDSSTVVTYKLPLKVELPKRSAKNKISSAYNLTFSATGFEADSGRSVDISKSIIVSDLPYIVGYKSDGNLKKLNRKDIQSIEFIAIDNSGKKISASALTLELKKINNIKELVQGQDGSYSYQSVPTELSLSKTQIDIPGSSYIYNVPTKEAGDYIIYLSNKQGTIVASVEFSVTDDLNISDSTNAKLSLELDKQDYQAGDTILVKVTAPYPGYGLITIETNKIHNFTWFNTDKTTSIQEIKLPSDFAGKGYINVQFMQDISLQGVFAPNFAEAIASFTSDISKHEQTIDLMVPKKIKAGEKLTIEYRLLKPGKILIYAVDEGILSFANYQYPDPINYFIKDAKQEVQTSHISDTILPQYAPMMKAYMLADSASPNSVDFSKHLNPFKRKDQPPVVFWSGIIDTTLPKGSMGLTVIPQITFDIPGYFNGTLKIIAVSLGEDSAGEATKEILVQSDFIITPNLPLFVAPNDEFIVPITIANNLEKSGKATINLDITTNQGLEIIKAPKQIAIEYGKETTIHVKLKATDHLGSAELKIEASLDKNKSILTTNTSVRPALPNNITVNTGYEASNKLTLKVSRDLYPEFAHLQLSLSKLPLAIIAGFREYLEQYPFNNTQQLISKNFPNIMLYNEQELHKILHFDKAKIDKALEQVFKQLSERQNNDGGFYLWNNYNESNDFISVYVMHFLTEAANRNLPIPNGTFNLGITYLKNMANRSIDSLDSAREKAYAIYVLTKNKEDTKYYLSNVLNYLETSEKDVWHDDLTAVYLAASYKMLQMDDLADNILNNFSLKSSLSLLPIAKSVEFNYKERGAKPIYNREVTSDDVSEFKSFGYYNELIKYSQYLYLISLHFPERLKAIDPLMIQDIASLANDHYNSLSASYAIMASVAYADSINTNEKITVKLKTYAQNKQQEEVTLEEDKILQSSPGIDIDSLEIISSSPGFFYQFLTAGFDRKLEANKEIVKGVELERKYLNEKGEEIQKVKLGDIIMVSLEMRSGSDSILSNMAVIDMLPGGFELQEDSPSANIKMPIFDYIERREDRIILFGTIPNYKKQYQYKIKAVNKGRFALPAPYCESMYNPNIYYRGAVKDIIVE